ncbi:hypothetical protein WICPIJ_008635 [Wickerhamomyces pijperi]|uniref:DUF4484 domain-containing protein n=1 Tax=Wickerhamomyces pijperi TaxID=599730 RepID=A0A9P8THS9_WICPI|nr:hypothetical protein WICPIJ_008635 [Wickerhamomyces pijperi]
MSSSSSSINNLSVPASTRLASQSSPIISTQPIPTPTTLTQASTTTANNKKDTSYEKSRSPLAAIFLAQFDVKSGYVLKYHHSSTSQDQVNIKGLEYKVLPSGLHEVEQDIISFVQPKSSNTEDSQNYVYCGLAVFHQNLNKNGNNRDRSLVKMYSLGILIDPQTSGNSAEQSYTGGLDYVEALTDLLREWEQQQQQQSKAGDGDQFGIFEEFFNQNQQQTQQQVSTVTTNSVIESTPLKSSESLKQLYDHLGPLVFPLWKASLLHKNRILLISSHSHDIKLFNSYIRGLLKISEIPANIHQLLIDSGINSEKMMTPLRPLFTVGINDLDWLKSLQQEGWIAFSTDEILVYKSDVYDYVLKLNSGAFSESDFPKLIQSSKATHISNPAGNEFQVKATQRDLRRCRFINSKLKSQAPIAETEEPQYPAYWDALTKPQSWRQLAWESVFFLFNNSSSNSTLTSTTCQPPKQHSSPPLQSLVNESENHQDWTMSNNLTALTDSELELQQSKFILSYFQSLTTRTFIHISQMITNHTQNNRYRSPQTTDGGISLNSSAASAFSSEESSSSNLNHRSSPGLELTLEFNDVAQMGLDPYEREDWLFARDLILKYWGNGKVKNVKFGSGWTLCCFK